MVNERHLFNFLVYYCQRSRLIGLKCNSTYLLFLLLWLTHVLMLLILSFSTNAALEIFALDLSSGDTEMPLKGTVASEHRYKCALQVQPYPSAKKLKLNFIG